MSNDSKTFFKSSKPKLLTSFESIVDKMVFQEEKKIQRLQTEHHYCSMTW
jgi:hypothetical protein